MKKNVPVLFIFGIAIVISALILLFLVNNKDSLFWVSLSFLEFSLVVTAAITLCVAGDTRFSFPLGISIVVFSGIYVILVAAIDLLFGWLLHVDLSAFICIHLVALAAFIIVGVLLLLARGSIAKQNEAAYAASYEQQLLLGEVQRLNFMIRKLPDSVYQDAEHELSMLHDAIRFSDLVLDRTLSDIDNRIRSKVFALACEIDNLIDIQSDDISAIRAVVSDVRQLIEVRNLQIKNDKIRI